MTLADWTASETLRRLTMWRDIGGRNGRAVDVPASALKAAGLYNGQAGIFFDGDRTRSDWSPRGAAVSFRHTGTSYADDLSEDGLIYHYPLTLRRGSHDEGEIEAARTAYRLGLPVFAIVGSKNSTGRDIRLAYVEEVDDPNRMLLLTFVPSLIPANPSLAADPFDLRELPAEPVLRRVRERPNQQRFAAAVFATYGTTCAVCSFAVQGIVQAAHLVAKSRGGVDDPRNGLPLCANHHLSFDRGLWFFEVETTRIVVSEAATCESLGITRRDLLHLSTRPHADALRESAKRI